MNATDAVIDIISNQYTGDGWTYKIRFDNGQILGTLAAWSSKQSAMTAAKERIAKYRAKRAREAHIDAKGGA